MRRLFLTLVAVTFTASAVASPERFQTFLNDYCIGCHGPDKQKGDRRYDRLQLPPQDTDTLVELQEILDQLNVGEMPPPKKPQPSSIDRRAMVDWLTETIRVAHAERASTGGQTVLRRLNRREYINTIGDLCGVNMTMFDPTRKFPRDRTSESMDNIGDTLVTSGYLLAQYLEAADLIVEKALRQAEPTPTRTWRFAGNFKQQPELAYPHGKVFKYRYLCLYENRHSTRHEGAYGPIHDFADGVPADGWYTIRVRAQAMHRDTPYHPSITKLDASEPFRLGIVPGDIKVGALHLPQPIEPQLAETVIGDDAPDWYEFKVWLDEGYTPRFTFPNGMIDGRGAFSRVLARHNKLFPEHVRKTRGIFEARPVVLRHGQFPHIRISEVEIRGPLPKSWPPASHLAMLGEEGFQPGREREILRRFASRAYRRPAREDEVDRLLRVVETRRSEGRSEFDALKDGLKAVLCSPAFLYQVEPVDQDAPQLTAHELASRLSYFLHATMPDAELRATADSGRIFEEAELLRQTRRLLASPRSNRFVAAFLDSWLNLRSLGDMPPDRTTFVDYYADDLQDAMLRETRLFARDLIDRNASVLAFLDSDHSFVNRNLAKLYGMADLVPPDSGHEFRRVALSDRNRGGLLGQGSILTVTANGIETSPVTRGIWLMENILGTPPPPPPDDVPPIDPDVRGAKSIREILAKHRETPACHDCHRRIDPLGFALENFDPVGRWRTSYGRRVTVDASGEMPSGEHFHSVADFKKILLSKPETFIRGLTSRLLTFACGRRMEALDRPEIDRVIEKAKADDLGFRSLIEQVVLSDAFRRR